MAAPGFLPNTDREKEAMADDKAPQSDKAPASDPAAGENVAPTQGREGDENDTSAYVGVDPIYANYANETERPRAAEEGVEALYDELAVQRQAEAAERATKVGVTGYSGSVDRSAAPGDREAELRAALKQEAKVNADLDKQRKQAREQRAPGAQV